MLCLSLFVPTSQKWLVYSCCPTKQVCVCEREDWMFDLYCFYNMFIIYNNNNSLSSGIVIAGECIPLSLHWGWVDRNNFPFNTWSRVHPIWGFLFPRLQYLITDNQGLQWLFSMHAQDFAISITSELCAHWPTSSWGYYFVAMVSLSVWLLFAKMSNSLFLLSRFLFLFDSVDCRTVQWTHFFWTKRLLGCEGHKEGSRTQFWPPTPQGPLCCKVDT